MCHAIRTLVSQIQMWLRKSRVSLMTQVVPNFELHRYCYANPILWSNVSAHFTNSDSILCSFMASDPSWYRCLPLYIALLIRIVYSIKPALCFHLLNTSHNRRHHIKLSGHYFAKTYVCVKASDSCWRARFAVSWHEYMRPSCYGPCEMRDRNLLMGHREPTIPGSYTHLLGMCVVRELDRQEEQETASHLSSWTIPYKVHILGR
jgi:hypothetical protein